MGGFTTEAPACLVLSNLSANPFWLAVASVCLAAVLAERGYRILVVDLDPQASASLSLGRGREPGLYRAIAEKYAGA